MYVSRLLVAGLAVFASSIHATVAAQATFPHAPISGVEVNSNNVSGTVAIDGSYNSGTATFAGFTASCSTGTVSGRVDRGPNPLPKMRFTALDLTCDSPLGDDAVITLVNNAACNIVVNMGDAVVHNTNAVDTGASKNADPSNVDGSVTVPTGSGTPYPCLRVSVLGSCTFYVDGSMLVNFDEAIKTLGGVNYQGVVLKGNNLRTQNPSFGCLGLVSNNGAITLNNIRFDLKVSAGTIARGINFY